MKRAGIAVLLGLCAGLAFADEGPVEVDARHDGKNIIISAHFAAEVPKDVAWQVMTDFEHMPQFMPQLDQSKVLQRDGDKWTVSQHGYVRVALFNVSFDSVREIQLKPTEELDARSIGGDAGQMQSVAQLSQLGAQTVVSYHAVWQPTSSLLASLGIGLLKSQLSAQFSAMRQEMKRRLVHAAS